MQVKNKTITREKLNKISEGGADMPLLLVFHAYISVTRQPFHRHRRASKRRYAYRAGHRIIRLFVEIADVPVIISNMPHFLIDLSRGAN